jgi:ABC-type polysaccharide/polyol phosphate transport system ATPase subunit
LPTSSDGRIRVERVWKRFREDRRRPELAEQFALLLRRMSRNNPWRWVLRDIDFEIEPGDAVGIVGINGAGKTTLLKILTQVMYPTSGKVDLTGKVGALIELRGGMHPDLTGRENALLYGSLMGLGRKEVVRRFDDIVDFAQLAGAIDRQVKFFSSGMQMRLGFAIAAYMNPDVLLVDEVLAVGDAWFQQRCLDRIRDVLQQGTTLVLVSHDLASVESVCRRGLWLRNGVLNDDGPIRDVLAGYRKSVEEFSFDNLSHGGIVRIVDIQLNDSGSAILASHGQLDIKLWLQTYERERGRLYIGVSEGPGTPTFLVSTEIILEEGDTTVRCHIDNIPLPKGRYYAWICMEAVDDRKLIPWHPAATFEVFGSDLDYAPLGIVRLSPVHVKSDWSQEAGGPIDVEPVVEGETDRPATAVE